MVWMVERKTKVAEARELLRGHQVCILTGHSSDYDRKDRKLRPYLVASVTKRSSQVVLLLEDNRLEWEFVSPSLQ
jgi:hypothetical protein